MVREPEAILEAQSSVILKIEEPKVDADRPWEDDLLNRQEIATRLTNLVANQEAPLTVSLHGQWGTGKTFMLRRWQKDLESEEKGYRAIYFNAWEDDFCDDPLLAFIGQLSEYFGKAGQGSLLEQTVQKALPLIRENLTGILRATTGVSIDLNQLARREKSLLEIYQEQRVTKDELKEELASLAQKVAEETGHPLVFIIDELDRCRPTFAIELLERVKHIFDVPHIVFVFGLNRDELCKSLTSVYGEIDADVYLRRFFDFEFNLPEADPQKFAESLMIKYGLDTRPQVLNFDGFRGSARQYADFIQICAILWSGASLSLRDIDYGMRLLALLAKNDAISNHAVPHFVALLICVKFKSPELYRSLKSGKFRTREIIDYLVSESRADMDSRSFEFQLDRIEGFLYCVDINNPTTGERGADALDELEREAGGSSGTRALCLSLRAQNSDSRQRERIKKAIFEGRNQFLRGTVFGELAAIIDTYQSNLRR